MSNEVKLSDDQMIFSIEELKKAGFSHYKINQMVEDGDKECSRRKESIQNL